MATLRADLVSRTTNFEKGMIRAGQSGQRFGKAMKAAVAVASGAIAGASAALTALTVAQMRVIDQTAKVASKLGIMVSELQALRLVANESGVATNTLDMALQRMTRRVSEAAQGTGEAKAALKELGLDAKTLASLAPEKQFEMIAKRLETVGTQGDRVRLAFKLFDSEGVGLVNMLGDISGSLQSARDFNDKFNISLSRTDASKVEEANDAFGRVKLAATGLGNTIAVQVAPLITAVSNALLEAGISGESFGRSVHNAMRAAGVAIDFVRHAIQGVKIVLAQASLGVDLLVMDATSGLFKIAKAAEAMPLIGEAMKDVQQGVLNLNEAAQMSAETSLRNIKKVQKESAGFVATMDAVWKEQEKAELRAASRIAAGGKKPREQEAVQQAIKETTKETEKLAEATEKFGFKSDDAFRGFISDLSRGVDAMTAFHRVASSILDDVIRKMFSSGSGGGGGIGGAIADGISSLVGGFFGGDISGGKSFNPVTTAPPPKPSFATGSRFVPRDMTARIHKGEMIIPRSQVGGSSGQGVTVNIINNTPSNVSTKQSNDGMSFEVLIDQAIADRVGDRSSRTSQTLNAQMARTLIRR